MIVLLLGPPGVKVETIFYPLPPLLRTPLPHELAKIEADLNLIFPSSKQKSSLEAQDFGKLLEKIARAEHMVCITSQEMWLSPRCVSVLVDHLRIASCDRGVRIFISVRSLEILDYLQHTEVPCEVRICDSDLYFYEFWNRAELSRLSIAKGACSWSSLHTSGLLSVTF